MTRIYASSMYDTPEIVVLRNQINGDDEAFSKLRDEFYRREREQAEQYDELLLAQRPTYPLPDHLTGLDSIASMLADGTPYGDHLGYPTPEDHAAGRALPECVKFHTKVRRINLYALAPYRAKDTNRIWTFTTEERAMLRGELRIRGLRAFSEWSHEDGIGFLVSSR